MGSSFDFNGFLRYKLISLYSIPTKHILYLGDDDDDGKKFGTDSDSKGAIDLRTIKPLDYEKRKKYDLKLKMINVDESDMSPLAHTLIDFTVHVKDINDMAPKFKEIVVVPTPEDLKKGSVIFKVTAIDLDSDQVYYALVGKVSLYYIFIYSLFREFSAQKAL